MKVLLIPPRVMEYLSSQAAEGFEEAIGLVPSLGLAYLAASLERERHEVAILDCEALALNPHGIREINFVNESITPCQIRYVKICWLLRDI